MSDGYRKARAGEAKRAIEILEADGFDMKWATSLDEAVETIIEQRQAARAELTTAGGALVRATVPRTEKGGVR